MHHSGTDDPNTASADGPPDGHGSSGPPPRRDFATTPLVVTWETSQACELACDHCRADAKPDRDPAELDFDEAVSLFEQVASFDPHPFLVLSGGDPLERPDIFELLSKAVDIGITPSITPATTPNLDRETIERFASIGVGRMALSLDGANAEEHDRFRGEPGTFAATMRAAKQANAAGVPIQFNTTVTARTANRLPDIADIVEQFGAAMWEVFFLVPVGRGAELEQLTPDRARAVMEWLYDRGSAGRYRLITVEAPFYRRVAREIADTDGRSTAHVGSTGAGNGFVFVSHTGDVYPSGFMPISAGNIREEPLPTIYRESELLNRLRDRKSFDGPCGDCPATEYCGGSRSRAYAATGNPYGSDPLCPWAANQMAAGSSPP